MEQGCSVEGEEAECTTLDDSFISGTARCGMTGLWIIDDCVAGENGPCTTENGCAEGLLCVPTGPVGACLKSCDPTAPETGCGEGFRCHGTNEPTVGLCAEEVVSRDEPCDLLSACVDPAAECLPGYFGFSQETVAFECKLTCEFSDLGAQGSCPAGESCLENPVQLPEPQLNQNGEVVTCVDDAPCDGGRGFFCIPNNQTGGACGRIQTWCGTPAPLITGPLAGLSRDDTCGLPGTSQYCEPLADGDAIVECQTLLSVFGPLDDAGNPISCRSNAECAPRFGIECVETGNGGVCGTFAKGCLAFCELPGGQNLDCGAGLTCTRLPLSEYPGSGIEFQPAEIGMGDQPCDGPNDTTSCEQSYECLQVGQTEHVCARAPKICTQ